MWIIASLFLYSLVFGLTLTLMWCVWRLSGLRHTADFKTGRFLILSMVGFAALAAVVPFHQARKMALSAVEVTVAPAVGAEVESVGFGAEMTVADLPAQQAPLIGFDTLVAAYGVGLALSALWLIGSLAYVWWLMLRSRRSDIPGLRISRRAVVPFSWGGWIVMSATDRNGLGFNSIMAHECVHCRKHHWLDLLALRVAGCLTWYLPTVRLLRADLIDNHEYAADAGVMDSGCDPKAYQMLLIEKATHRRLNSTLVNSLNYSSIKKRITMMQTNQPARRRGRVRALALLPAALLVLVAVSSPALADSMRDRIPQIVPEQEPVADNDVVDEVPEPASVSEQDADDIVAQPEVMPEFSGGAGQLYEFIGRNIRYPENAARNNVQGRVIVQFVVEKDGSVGNDVKIVRSPDEELSAEAIRLVKILPKFTPGKVNGKPVRVLFSLPLTFRLSSDVPESKSAENVPPAFYRQISKNMRYPKNAANNDVSGIVYVVFRGDKMSGNIIVDKVLSLPDSKSDKSIPTDEEMEYLRDEAVRVLKVAVPAKDLEDSKSYKLSVEFRLQDKTPDHQQPDLSAFPELAKLDGAVLVTGLGPSNIK